MTQITLYIGVTRGGIVTFLNNVDDVKFFVENYIAGAYYFIGDLSKLSAVALSVFLKFLEDKVEGTIDFYASQDNLSPTLVSRFTRIVKHRAGSGGSGVFKDYVSLLRSDSDLSTSFFYGSAPEYLDKRVRYFRLPRGLQNKVGDIL